LFFIPVKQNKFYLENTPSLYGLMETASGMRLIVGSAVGALFISCPGVARMFWLSLTVVG